MGGGGFVEFEKKLLNGGVFFCRVSPASQHGNSSEAFSWGLEKWDFFLCIYIYIYKHAKGNGTLRRRKHIIRYCSLPAPIDKWMARGGQGAPRDYGKASFPLPKGC